MTGESLKEIRIELNLTQASIAEKLGIDRKTVNRWERGINEIPTIAEYAIIGLASCIDV